MTVNSPPSAAMLIVAGQGVDGLRRTLEAVTAAPDHVWCAVATEAEAEASVGHAVTILIDPWPGQRAALATLVAKASIGDDDVVQTLIAGSLPDHRVMRSSLRRRYRRLVIPAMGHWRRTRGLGTRSVRQAILHPGAGMTLPGAGLHDLARLGWFDGANLTVTEIRSIVGDVRISHSETVPNASPPPRPPTPDVEALTVTVVIPAYNEESCIGDTVRSIAAQSRRPEAVLVVDDGSSDRTGAIASHTGAQILRTEGTGSKGEAINAALESVQTDVIILVDADTRLHADAVHHLMRDMEAGADATHGSVFPVVERGLWARGRLIEYATALRIHKRVQRSLGQIMVLSGCVLAVRTDVLRAAGGFQARTMVEDLDLTWTLHQRGLRVEYSPRAVAYPTEPTSWVQYRAQMRRWARGFFQAVAVHARTLHRTPALALIIVTSLWDALTAPVLIAILIGLAAFGLAPMHALLLMGAWQLAWTAVAVLIAASVVGLRRALAGAPGYTVVSLLASFFYIEALITEWILRRRLRTWVKGH